MSGLGQLLQELFNVLQDDTSLAYNAVSATVLFFYEILITFPDEVRLVWRSSWSLITILHILIRYYSLAFLIMNTYVSISTTLSPEFCATFDVLQVWGATALVPVVDILIIIRVYALYPGNKWIGGVLVFFWSVETGVIFYLTAKGFSSNNAAMPDPLPGILPGCFPIDPFKSKTITHAGGLAISCQGVYLGLALYKLWRQMKNFKLLRSMTPLLRIFFRDGALYCFNILAMYILNVVVVQYGRSGPVQGIGEVWIVSVVAITAGRLVLNLRNSVQTPEGRVSDESYELHCTADNNGQFSSIIILDTYAAPNTPRGHPPFSIDP